VEKTAVLTNLLQATCDVVAQVGASSIGDYGVGRRRVWSLKKNRQSEKAWPTEGRKALLKSGSWRREGVGEYAHFQVVANNSDDDGRTRNGGFEKSIGRS
jgi:hypothetical protein